MAKRYTDTEKWNQWFRALKVEHKLFWLYIQDACDCVGVYEVDIPKADFCTCCKLDMDDLLKIFGSKIHIINGGEKWWIKEFCRFQYMELEEGKGGKPEQSYIKKLKNYGLWDIYKNLVPNSGIVTDVNSINNQALDIDSYPVPGPASAPKEKEQEEEKVIKEEKKEESVEEKERLLRGHSRKNDWFKPLSQNYEVKDIMNEWEIYLQELRNNGKYQKMLAFEMIKDFPDYIKKKSTKKYNAPF